MLLRREFGPLLATSSGDGLYALGVRKTIRLTLVITVDPDSIERNPDGTIDLAYPRFIAKYSPQHWNIRDLNIMYTDSGIVGSINDYLTNIGFAVTREMKRKGYTLVSWSEAGRQYMEGEADFDMSNALLTQIWPELRVQSRVLT